MCQGVPGVIKLHCLENGVQAGITWVEQRHQGDWALTKVLEKQVTRNHRVFSDPQHTKKLSKTELLKAIHSWI